MLYGKKDNSGKAVRPADRKFAAMMTKRGKASNRQGIAYGARTAGAASEQFEPGRRKGVVHTHGSHKQIKGKPPRQREHTRERRIV
ncbi:MAG TPA: hypothetical protein VGP72_27220 [Planctomycetota bacterium]